MKKQYKTFAERAKEIQKRFPRAEWDKIERKDLANEMRKLKEEQEAFREAMGMNQQEQEQPQEQQEYAGGGPGIGTGDVYKNLHKTTPLYRSDPFFKSNIAPSKIAAAGSLPNTNNVGLSWGKSMGMATEANRPGASAQYQPIQSSGWATAISGAAALMSSLYAMRQANNMPDPEKYPRVAPKYASYAPERSALQGQYGNAINTMLANTRGMSNPANTYANQIAGISALTDSMGQGLSQSYQNEYNKNVDIENAFANTNANLGAQEAQDINRTNMAKYQMKSQALSDIGNIPGEMLRDRRAQTSQDMMMNTLGKDYGFYQRNPNSYTNAWERFKANLMGGQYYVKPRAGVAQ